MKLKVGLLSKGLVRNATNLAGENYQQNISQRVKGQMDYSITRGRSRDTSIVREDNVVVTMAILFSMLSLVSQIFIAHIHGGISLFIANFLTHNH